MKKYLVLFVIANIIGFFWDSAQSGIGRHYDNGDRVLFVFFSMVATPTLLVVSHFRKTGVWATMVYWLKHGLLTWLALIPLFFIVHKIDNPAEFSISNGQNLRGGVATMYLILMSCYTSLVFLPLSGSVVVLVRAWKTKKQEQGTSTTNERVA